MYTSINFKTKKALKEAVKRGESISVYQPGRFPGATDGEVFLEGPHYPEPHRWSAEAVIKDSIVISIK